MEYIANCKLDCIKRNKPEQKVQGYLTSRKCTLHIFPNIKTWEYFNIRKKLSLITLANICQSFCSIRRNHWVRCRNLQSRRGIYEAGGPCRNLAFCICAHWSWQVEMMGVSCYGLDKSCEMASEAAASEGDCGD